MYSQVGRSVSATDLNGPLKVWFEQHLSLLMFFQHFHLLLLLLLLLLSRFSRVQLCATPWRQPIRLHCPWDFPGKNTGAGCHFLLQCRKVKSESEVAQLCLTLHDPMDCSLPGSSVHGISQARVLEWGAIAFSLDINMHELLYNIWLFLSSLCIIGPRFIHLVRTDTNTFFFIAE